MHQLHACVSLGISVFTLSYMVKSCSHAALCKYSVCAPVTRSTLSTIIISIRSQGVHVVVDTLFTSTSTIIKQPQLILLGFSTLSLAFSLLCSTAEFVAMPAGSKHCLSPTAAKRHTDTILLETFKTAAALCSLLPQCHTCASCMAQALCHVSVSTAQMCHNHHAGQVESTASW